MSSNSSTCSSNDNLCIVTHHQLAVIIVPVLLLVSTLVTLLVLFLKVYCPDGRKRRSQPSHRSSSHRRTHTNTHPHHSRRRLQGIDAPPGMDPLEHEELPMQQQQVNVRPSLAPPPPEKPHGCFSSISVMPRLLLSVQSESSVSLYTASMEGRGVVLHVLKDAASLREKQDFLSFTSFLSGLGPHPFLPALVGVVTARPPLMLAVEELQQRHLLDFLWRCRQGGGSPPVELTEQRLFIMAGQVATALGYLHTQGCVHGNVGARSVLVSRELTAKLWGLGPAHRRTRGVQDQNQDLDIRKWHPPEVLAGGGVTPNSDVWSLGVLLYEMVTLGEPPFAEIRTEELLLRLQRGEHLRRPPTCSTSLHALIQWCCRWTPSSRPSVINVTSVLRSEESSANHRTALIVAQPMELDRYLREAGHGDAFNYAVL